MYSTFQRLNNLTSLATTYIMILLGLISVASFLALPQVELGKIDIKDLIMLDLTPYKPHLRAEKTVSKAG